MYMYAQVCVCLVMYDVSCVYEQVETIGDAYMVSSGVPSRSVNKHAGDVTRLIRLRHYFASMCAFIGRCRRSGDDGVGPASAVPTVCHQTHA